MHSNFNDTQFVQYYTLKQSMDNRF